MASSSSSSTYSRRPKNSAFYNRLNKIEEEQSSAEEPQDEELKRRVYFADVASVGECVENKVGVASDVDEEQKRFLRNVGVHRDYSSRTSCEANCTTLPRLFQTPPTLTFPMLDAKSSSQAVTQLQDAMEARLLEHDIVVLLAVKDVLNLDSLIKLAQRTFFDHIELSQLGKLDQGQLSSAKISHFVINALDVLDESQISRENILKWLGLRDFIISKLLQIEGWEISKSDRLHLFLKWHTVNSEMIRLEKDYKTKWLSEGLLDTFDTDDVRDQKLVLRKIVNLCSSPSLVWRILELVPYFDKYDFTNDPVLVSYLWNNFIWQFYRDPATSRDKIGFLDLIVQLWNMWEELNIPLTINVDNRSSASPIFDDKKSSNSEQLDQTRVVTDELLPKFVSFLDSMTPQQRLMADDKIRRAATILARQPNFDTSNDSSDTQLPIYFPFLDDRNNE